MATYYIDGVSGSASGDGLSPKSARSTCADLSVKAGDEVLFKRGSVFCGQLNITQGDESACVSYGAYGTGAPPVFSLSVDVSAKECWRKTERENVWECITPTDGEVGNFVFNSSECTAALRWEECGLKAQGDFWDSRFGTSESRTPVPPQRLLMYSVGNPSEVYEKIECIPYACRVIGRLCSNVVISDLHFKNSGVHALAGSGNNITVRNCIFENIGGCVWSKEQRIRFGNGFEIWYSGNDITVEGCYFKNIYDSCVTHQGPGERTVTAVNFTCRRNVFDTYGMAAFEYRDKLPISSSFTHNVCKNAGCGFAMLGEDIPRRSEIWPQPMGHHIFLWRIPNADEGGLYIANNIFGTAPVGAAIYSIISRQAEDRITLESNLYTRNDKLLIRFNGEDFCDLRTYCEKTGKDKTSRYTEEFSPDSPF